MAERRDGLGEATKLPPIAKVAQPERTSTSASRSCSTLLPRRRPRMTVECRGAARAGIRVDRCGGGSGAPCMYTEKVLYPRPFSAPSPAFQSVNGQPFLLHVVVVIVVRRRCVIRRLRIETRDGLRLRRNRMLTRVRRRTRLATLARHRIVGAYRGRWAWRHYQLTERRHALKPLCATPWAHRLAPSAAEGVH